MNRGCYGLKGARLTAGVEVSRAIDGHYYSPVPDLADVRQLQERMDQGAEMARSIGLNPAAQISLLRVCVVAVGSDFASAMMLDVNDRFFANQKP